MTANLTPGRDLLPQYRDLACQYADQALTALEREDPLSPKTIHEVRVAIKHLRALGQLLRPFQGKRAHRRADRELRDAARELSGARDLHVLRKTLDELPDATRRSYEHQALSRVREQEFPESPDDTRVERPDSVIEALCHCRASWEALELSLDDATLIDEGLGRSYKKTRKLGFEALAADTPEDWHQFRKWVKYLYFQLQPLAPALETGPVRPEDLDALGKRLGKLHDLHVLIDTLSQRERGGEHGEQIAITNLVVRRRETTLLDEARKGVRYCFEMKPKVFRQQTRAACARWRRQEAG
jgi:CHAD domain-containing protein